ncbi:MAG: trypsin-like peptidase domain-containing protein [Candidatus Eremiobacteraeota bacterium]|nr:trypsin-like peptidase domain-containing protein [Candidatus Eremiobacteraeota bacterium]
MIAFMLLALVGAPVREVRTQELLSSVIISGTCARGCQGDKRLFGTGEIVDRQGDGRLVVLTARHVIADMSDPRVYLRNGSPEGTPIIAAVRADRGLPARVIARSPDADLALIAFRPEPDDAYDVATFSRDASVEVGDVVGGPNGALWTVSHYRRVAAADDATVVLCETCGPGDSGGGVFDRHGALAGILVSQQVFVRDDEPLADAARSTRFKIIPLADVRTFVKARQLAPAPLAANDPWSRFGPATDAPPNAPSSSFSRFDH